MVSVKVDLRAFNKQFAEYTKFNKRALSEIVNTKAYFIARNAVMTTQTTDKQQIEDSLMRPSKTDPRAPVAAIICAVQQSRARFSKKTGKRLKDKAGLVGPRMKTAMNKLIRVRQATRNFLRSGWIPAIKALERYLDKKSGPSYKKPVTKGQPKGGGTGAPKDGGWRVKAEIWNSVMGGTKKHGLNKPNTTSKVIAIITKGLQKAVDKETASMRDYVEKKLAKGVKEANRFS